MAIGTLRSKRDTGTDTGIDVPAADTLLLRLNALGNPGIASHSQRFFKTGTGEYGEGDQFLGIRVPVLRQLVKDCRGISRAETLILLQNPFHEARLLALLLLVDQYQRGGIEERAAICRDYLANTGFINNWDLVDSSAHLIVGPQLAGKLRQLFKLVRSRSLWERRIAIMATFHCIRQGEFATTLAICEQLLPDPEDLLHKACGWMLREIGKRDQATARRFLDRHCAHMPRTMLRYAIEKFPEPLRQAYLEQGRARKNAH